MIIERTPLHILKTIQRIFPDHIFASAARMSLDKLTETLAKSLYMDLLDAEDTALLLGTISRWGVAPVSYVFSAALATALIGTVPDQGGGSELPCDILQQLSGRCLYIQSPIIANGFNGFFAWIDPVESCPEMVFLFLADDMVQSLGWRVRMEPSAVLSACLPDAQALCFDLCQKVRNGSTAALALLDGTVSYGGSVAETVQGMILRGLQLVLYCLSENADLADMDVPVPDASGLVMRNVSVGGRISHSLPDHASENRTPLHIRRGHWHSYWIGSKKDTANRQKVLRWIPPVLIGENSAKIQKDIQIITVE